MKGKAESFERIGWILLGHDAIAMERIRRQAHPGGQAQAFQAVHLVNVARRHVTGVVRVVFLVFAFR
jgi:hypothetical protein